MARNHKPLCGHAGNLGPDDCTICNPRPTTATIHAREMENRAFEMRRAASAVTDPFAAEHLLCGAKTLDEMREARDAEIESLRATLTRVTAERDALRQAFDIESSRVEKIAEHVGAVEYVDSIGPVLTAIDEKFATAEERALRRAAEVCGAFAIERRADAEAFDERAYGADECRDRILALVNPAAGREGES